MPSTEGDYQYNMPSLICQANNVGLADRAYHRFLSALLLPCLVLRLCFLISHPQTNNVPQQEGSLPSVSFLVEGLNTIDLLGKGRTRTSKARQVNHSLRIPFPPPRLVRIAYSIETVNREVSNIEAITYAF